MVAKDPVRAARRSFDWIASNLRGFTPLSPDGVNVDALKALSEALLACELATRCTALKSHPAIEYLLDIAKNTWTDQRYVSFALRQPPAFRLYFAPLASLVQCGWRFRAEDRALIRQILARGYAARSDELPFRQMDCDALLTRLSCPLRPKRSEQPPLCRSLINRQLPPLELTREDAYNLTHLVFYATDWSRQAGLLTTEDLAYVEICIRFLLPKWTHYEDWDLVGELLIVAVCIGAHHSEPAHSGLMTYLSAQRREGTFPRPKRSRLRFAAKYHTAVVCAILGCVWELDSRPPQRRSLVWLVPGGIPALRMSLKKAVDRCLSSFQEVGEKDPRPHDSLIGPLISCLRYLRKDLSRLRTGAQTLAWPEKCEDEWALVAAVADYDLIEIGRLLVALADAQEFSPIGLEVIGWLIARQSWDGHFGSLAPERSRIEALAHNEIDFSTQAQWPTTAAVIAGISKYTGRLVEELDHSSRRAERVHPRPIDSLPHRSSTKHTMRANAASPPRKRKGKQPSQTR